MGRKIMFRQVTGTKHLGKKKKKATTKYEQRKDIDNMNLLETLDNQKQVLQDLTENVYVNFPGSAEDKREKIRTAVKKEYPNWSGEFKQNSKEVRVYCDVVATYARYVIVRVYSYGNDYIGESGKNETYYKVPYKFIKGNVTLSRATEVELSGVKVKEIHEELEDDRLNLDEAKKKAKGGGRWVTVKGRKLFIGKGGKGTSKQGVAGQLKSFRKATAGESDASRAARGLPARKSGDTKPSSVVKNVFGTSKSGKIAKKTGLSKVTTSNISKILKKKTKVTISPLNISKTMKEKGMSKKEATKFLKKINLTL